MIIKNVLILFLLFTNLSVAQQKNENSNKETALSLCKEFTRHYSTSNTYSNNRMIYIKYVNVKLENFQSEKKENILRKLHELCPSFLEYSMISSKIKANSEGRPDAFKLWDNFINSSNNIPWEIKEKQQFLDVCNYALSEKKNTQEICKCTIDKISEKLNANYFLNLSISEQGYLGGQVAYIYCSQ